MKGQVWLAATEEYHRHLAPSVLLIEGEQDQFVPIEDALDMIRVLPSGYLVVVKNGSHMILMEKAEYVNKLIWLFLNDNFT